MKTKVLAIVMLLSLSGAILSGCSGTLDGAGKDIERAGEKIQQAF